ncbi:MAG: hypothetical protein EZS28_049370, partial [Streblomastix strix]
MSHIDVIPNLYQFLPELRTLTASRNNFRKFQITLGRLKQLEKLDLGSNQLDNFPHIELPKLNELILRSNKLLSIPHDLGKLFPAIISISLAFNRLVTLPRFENSSLIRIEADQNNIKYINHAIHAPKLKHLFLSCNDIQQFALPPQSNLNSVETVDLRMNSMKFISRSTYPSMPNVQALYLTHNDLTHLPIDIGDLTPHIHDFWIGENCIISIPNSINKMKMLQTLFAAYNNITFCPPLIGFKSELR